MPDTVLDVMRVPASGDPLVAVRPVGGETTKLVECDILVVGGGMGGVAAAWECPHLAWGERAVDDTDRRGVDKPW